ncbi:hypothetical protein J2S64_002522 [Paeniglutamicibacter sulfureus]|uniref:Uncharacterized protein n=1 Tax=Paeniglutamicibacter sulfureus TaxID=43666 RepID=A0ABU2BJK2_9MICC|nr:hypothetical protein [Paeniglutamicibacter sulfureus]
MEKMFNYDLIGKFNGSDAKAVIKHAREWQAK